MSGKPPICALGIRNLIAAFYIRGRRDHVLAPVCRVVDRDHRCRDYILSEMFLWL
jgi:hypothetical protein